MSVYELINLQLEELLVGFHEVHLFQHNLTYTWSHFLRFQENFMKSCSVHEAQYFEIGWGPLSVKEH